MLKNELQRGVSQYIDTTKSKPPNPDEFKGGKDKFDHILYQIREDQKNIKSKSNDQTDEELDTKTDEPEPTGTRKRISNKRHNFKYGYPLKRRMRGSFDQICPLSSSMHSSIHSDGSESRAIEPRDKSNRPNKADINMSRQYSIMEDDTRASSSVVTPIQFKAVNNGSILPMDPQIGITFYSLNIHHNDIYKNRRITVLIYF